MTRMPTSPAQAVPNWLAHGVRWLIYCLILTTPFIFTWVNEELFEFPKMMWVYGFTALAIGLSLADQLIHRSWSWPKTKFDWLIGAFVFSQILSTIFSIHPHTSWFGYYTRFNGGLLSTLAYVSLYYLISKYFTAKQLIKLTQTAVLVAGFVALYALPEHFGFSPSCLLITKTAGVDCWVQDVQSRIFGTFGQPNWLAAYLITLLPLILAWLAVAKKSFIKISLIGLWLMFLAGVIFTQSRSGVLGFLTSVGVGGFLFIWHRFWQVFSAKSQMTDNSESGIAQKLQKNRWTWLGLVLTTLSLISWFGTPFTPTLKSLWTQNTPAAQTEVQSGTKLDTGGTESGEIRKIVWAGAIAIWQRYPILGSGLETFAYSYYQDRPASHNQVSEWDFLYNKAHNELLNYLATGGLMGLITYLGLWVGLSLSVLTWLKSHHSQSVPPSQKFFVAGWLAGLAAQFVSNFFGFSTVMINLLFWVGLAMIANWTNSAVPSVKTGTLNSSNLTTSTWLGLGIIFITTWWLVTRPMVWWQADRDFALSKALFTSSTYQAGLVKLEQAITKSPGEALYWDELANQYSRLVVGLQASPNASASQDIIAELTTAAVAASDQTLALNSRHLDFYKTRARVFINLSQVDASYLAAAAATLTTAESLAPTDPKLTYHLGLVELTAGATSSALKNLEKAVSMKPDYLAAWFDLGKAYEQANQLEKAKLTYQHILTSLAPNNPEVEAQLKALELTK